jgi:hypothetical protein
MNLTAVPTYNGVWDTLEQDEAWHNESRTTWTHEYLL